MILQNSLGTDEIYLIDRLSPLGQSELPVRWWMDRDSKYSRIVAGGISKLLVPMPVAVHSRQNHRTRECLDDQAKKYPGSYAGYDLF